MSCAECFSLRPRLKRHCQLSKRLERREEAKEEGEEAKETGDPLSAWSNSCFLKFVIRYCGGYGSLLQENGKGNEGA